MTQKCPQSLPFLPLWSSFFKNHLSLPPSLKGFSHYPSQKCSLSPLSAGSIVFVVLLRYLVLFRLRLCCWQGSKLKLFPVLRTKRLGVSLSPTSLMTWGFSWVGDVAQLLDPMTEAFGSKELWLPFTQWTVFSIKKQATVVRGSEDLWIIPGTWAKCGRGEII